MRAADLADKLLFDAANPGSGDKTISVVDPDARRGKHGHFFDGFMLDVMMDADSELVTALDVLPANGDEARNAIDLVKSEEAAQGNDIEVFTPPRAFNTNAGFDSSEFKLVEDGTRVQCPTGELSGRGGPRADKPNTVFFSFARDKCVGCPLLEKCIPYFKPTSRTGRRVSKNQYEPEYKPAREVALSDEYAEVRRKHPAIERKLNEFARHHGTRRARSRGRLKVKIQQLLTATAINMTRMVERLGEQSAPTGTLAAC